MDKTKKPFLRTIRMIDLEERKEMISKYLSGKYSKQKIWFDHTGQSVEHGKMLQWMRKLGIEDTVKHSPQENKVVFLSQQLPDFMATETGQSTEELERKIKALEASLASCALKTEGYKRMIEYAEKELKISIQKKPNTK